MSKVLVSYFSASGVTKTVSERVANKITGFVLFITPFIIVKYNPLIFEIIICSIATFAAVQEGYYLKIKKYASLSD